MLRLRDRSDKAISMRQYLDIWYIGGESVPRGEIPQKRFSARWRLNNDRNELTINAFCHPFRMAAVRPLSLGAVGRNDVQGACDEREGGGRSFSIFGSIYAPI
jgi:hypothetical protein